MNRIFLLIELSLVCVLQAHASLLISDSDISSNTYTYGLSFTDTANSSKFYSDVYSYSNVAVVQQGTGSSERHFITAESGSQSASVVYLFDFSKTKYRATSMTVSDDLYDGYTPSGTSTITTAYSVDNVNWTTIASVSTVGKTVDQNAGTTAFPVTFTTYPPQVFYRVTFTANSGSFVGTFNEWNRLASTGGWPFGVTINLSTTTIAPVTITPSNPSTVQTGIMAAYEAGSSSVTIPPGTYNLPSLSGGDHLNLTGMKNFTINAANVNLIFTDVTQRSIAFNNCSNVTFDGNGTTTMARGTIPTSQGTIQSISGQQINVLLDQGYPGYANSADVVDSSNFNPLGAINDIDPVTLQPKASVPDIYIGTQVVGGTTYPNIVALPNHVLQFTCTTPLSGLPIAVGDHLGWRGTVRVDIDLRLCQNMTMENFTMKGGAGFILHEVGQGGNNYSNITETYPDAPAGATQTPLLSSCADGFNSGVCVGPTLTNCSFEGLNDDGITLHGVYGLVTQAAAGNVVTANCPCPWGTLPYCKIGDALRFYDASGNYAGQSTITALATAPAGYTPPQPPPASNRYFNSATPVYVQITLATAVPTQANWVLSNQNMIGNGFTTTGCKVHNGRAHAMLLEAGNGTVQGCDFAYTANGLTVIPEIGSWGQSDYVQNLTITDNTFTNVGLARAFFLGALTVGAYEYNPTANTNQYVAYPGGHQNVTISNNTFRNCNNINMLISSAQNVQITNNNFIQPMTSSISLFGGTTDANQNALIWLTQCQGVSLSGNFVGSPGSYMTSPVVASSTASGTGFTSGITVGKEVGAFFDGGNSSTVVDAYPGTTGNGWLSAWTAATNVSTESASVMTTTPLYVDTDSYLQATVNTTASTASTATVYRKFDTASIDVTQPHQITFDFRPDTVDSNVRYFLSDRVGGGGPGTDGNDTWLILGYGNGWNFFNGNGAGSGSNVSSGISLVAGKTYHFVLYITPSTKSWTATITDGVNSYSTPTLGFRMNSTSDGQYLIFGASNNSAATASNYTFSLDSLMIANTFTPSLASDSSYRTKCRSFVQNMEKSFSPTLGLTLSVRSICTPHALNFGVEEKIKSKTSS